MHGGAWGVSVECWTIVYSDFSNMAATMTSVSMFSGRCGLVARWPEWPNGV